MGLIISSKTGKYSHLALKLANVGRREAVQKRLTVNMLSYESESRKISCHEFLCFFLWFGNARNSLETLFGNNSYDIIFFTPK